MLKLLNFSAIERALAGPVAENVSNAELLSYSARSCGPAFIACAPILSNLVEHIKHSACRTDFLNRVKSNELEKKEAKKAGKEAPECKRRAKEPLGAHIVKTDGKEPEFLAPINYEFVA